MSVTSTPCDATPSAKARLRDGELGRMSCPTTTPDAPPGFTTTWAKAEPMARATSSSSCSGTTPRTS